MHKKSTIITPLQEHQEKALRRALAENLILAHSTGSGKTLTSIAVADAIGAPTTVLTPASLVDNYRKELKKHKKGGPPVTVLSLPTAVLQDYQIPEGNTLIIDEAHALRNAGTQRQAYVKRQAERAGRILALTGTPAYNQMQDWAPLVNIVAKDHILPENPAVFKSRYTKEHEIRPSFLHRVVRNVTPGIVEDVAHMDELRELVSPYVDIFDKDIEKPARKDVIVHTGMSDEQAALYKIIAKNMPVSMWNKIQHNIPPSKAEARQLNAFLSGIRQVSNTAEAFNTEAKPGEKIQKAVKHLKARMKDNPELRALIYSNFIQSGVGSYAKLLDNAHIPYGMYTGALTPVQKKRLVDAYNSGAIRVLLASGSGSEGLDLKNTRLIQILEPHWNSSRIEQVIGRGIRYKSHEDLPEKDRNVLVEHYISDAPVVGLGIFKKRPTSVDKYLMTRAKEKQRLLDKVKSVLENGGEREKDSSQH